MKKLPLFCMPLLLAGVLFVQGSHAEDEEDARLGKGRIWGDRAVAYSPDGTRLAVASSLGIWLYDVHTGAEVDLPRGHTGWVYSVSFSPDGQTLASGGEDTTVRLWDVSSGQQKAVLKGHTDWVYSVSFSPDGQTLASGGEDTTVRLWDVSSGQQKAVLKGHTDWVYSVSFSPDGQTLASGSGKIKGSMDDTVRLWDVSSGQQKAVLDCSMPSVSFSPDGRTLASGGLFLSLWDVSSSNLHRPSGVCLFGIVWSHLGQWW